MAASPWETYSSRSKLRTQMSQDRNYDDDDVRAIIERALQAHPERGISHDDLLAVGAGVGLPRDAIERAAEEVREARTSELARAAVVARRRRGLTIHALVFLLVNAFLFAINFLTTPGEWWVLFSVFGWGLGVLFHTGFALLAGVSARRLARERRRQQRLDPSASVSSSSARTNERRSGVRVEGPLDSIEGHDREPLPAERAEAPDLVQRK